MRGPDPLRLLIVTALAAAIGVHAYFRLTADAPPRDRPGGASAIAGRITDERGAPVEGASIVASSRIADRTERWTATSDARGVYDAGGLPAGAYRVTVRKDGYLAAHYAVGDIHWLPTPIELAEGTTTADIDVILRPGATLSGRVLGDDGTPLARAYVRVSRVSPLERRLSSVSGARQIHPVESDGRYTVLDLEGGEYLISAERQGDDRIRVYHPDALKLSDARTVRVSPGETLSSVDLRVPVVSTTTATVTLRYEGDGFLRDAKLAIVDADADLSSRSDAATVTRREDGTFLVTELPAGRFELTATALAQHRQALGAAPDEAGPREYLWAATTLETDGVTPVSLALDWQDAVDLSGRLEWDDGSGDAPDRWRTILWLRPHTRGLRFTPRVMGADAGHAFTFRGLRPGRYTLALDGPASIRAMLVNGQPRLDRTIDVGREPIADVVVEMQPLVEQVEIAVRAEDGRPSAEAAVLLFPADPTAWNGMPGAVYLERPSTAGRLTLGNLPAGTYLAAAVRHLDPRWQGDLNHRAALEPLRAMAVPLALEPGGRHSVTLTVR